MSDNPPGGGSSTRCRYREKALEAAGGRVHHVPDHGQGVRLINSAAVASTLILASAAILLALGSAHLLYTFVGSKLMPRDPALLAAMKDGHPRITRETTMWKAWVGFNASHSLGAMLFGLLYGFLALRHSMLLLSSAYLLWVGLAMLVALTVLAKAYWFRVPLVGISLSSVLYVLAIVVAST